MNKTTLLSASAIAILLAATATSASAAGTSIIGDDYSRYASIEGPNAPLEQSFAPNRDDALLSALYGPFDYLFGAPHELDRNAVLAASTSAADTGPTS